MTQINKNKKEDRKLVTTIKYVNGFEQTPRLIAALALYLDEHECPRLPLPSKKNPQTHTHTHV